MLLCFGLLVGRPPHRAIIFPKPSSSRKRWLSVVHLLRGRECYQAACSRLLLFRFSSVAVAFCEALSEMNLSRAARNLSPVSLVVGSATLVEQQPARPVRLSVGLERELHRQQSLPRLRAGCLPSRDANCPATSLFLGSRESISGCWPLENAFSRRADS